MATKFIKDGKCILCGTLERARNATCPYCRQDMGWPANVLKALRYAPIDYPKFTRKDSPYVKIIKSRNRYNRKVIRLWYVAKHLKIV